MMKLNEFMIQSPTGKTHVVNPKTNKTYCGYPQTPTSLSLKVGEHALENIGWRFLDMLPSDDHKPSCLICERHYDDPLRDQLSGIAGELKGTINEFLCTTVILKDVKALGRFTELIAKFMRSERKLREKEKARSEG